MSVMQVFTLSSRGMVEAMVSKLDEQMVTRPRDDISMRKHRFLSWETVSL